MCLISFSMLEGVEGVEGLDQWQPGEGQWRNFANKNHFSSDFSLTNFFSGFAKEKLDIRISLIIAFFSTES